MDLDAELEKNEKMLEKYTCYRTGLLGIEGVVEHELLWTGV